MAAQQKDISLAWFKEFLLTSTKEIKALDNDKVVPFAEKKVRELIHSDFIYFLYLNKEDGSYRIPSLKRTFQTCDDEETLFSEVIKKKQPLLLKELKNSLLYQEKCDNLVSSKIDEVLLVPITFDRHTDTYPSILVWGAVKANSDYSFTQKTVLYLIKFLEGLKPYLLQINAEEFDYTELTLTQCLESNETLEYMMQRNKQYFHSIIHDIRTPMNALMGFLELLSINEIDATKKDYLHSALKSSEHMIRLISDALDIAKIESGELPIEKKLFNLADELSDTAKIFYETARKKHITLCAYFDPLLPSQMQSDHYRIKQVLSNLLSNAIKFTPQKGEILISALYNEEKDTITVSVKDNGIGIAKESQQNIFLPYRQEKNSTEREYGGTGLGLSISHQIVALLGGKLEVESEEGKGSRFYFTIPASTEQEFQVDFDLKKTKKHKVFLYKWKKREDLRATTILQYLKNFGIKVLKGDPEEALITCYQKKESFDTLLLEKETISEDDYEWVQRLLDDGYKVVWLEDVFDTTTNWFQGDIKKVAYPVLSKDLFQALSSIPVKILTQETKKDSYANKHVLVVDDNRINLKFMLEVLKRFQVETILAEDAENALKEMKKTNFDLVFMDENMPKMLGSEAIRHIREEEEKEKTGHIPLVSLSGDSEHKDRILAAGADEVLTKPVQLNILNDVLKKYLT